MKEVAEKIGRTKRSRAGKNSQTGCRTWQAKRIKECQSPRPIDIFLLQASIEHLLSHKFDGMHAKGWAILMTIQVSKNRQTTLTDIR